MNTDNAQNETSESGKPNFPAYVRKRCGGIWVQAHRLNGQANLTIEENRSISNRFPAICKQLEFLIPTSDFSFNAKLEIRSGNRFLSSEEILKVLNSEAEIEEENAVLNVLDVVVQEKSFIERMKILDEFSFPQLSLVSPKPGLNRSPLVLAKSEEEVEEVVLKMKRLPNSEGAIVDYSNLEKSEEYENSTSESEFQYLVKAERNDPYLFLPSEDRKYPFVVHQHWRGKSVHSDLRIGFKPEKLLIGWTLNTEISDVIKEPVTTLTDARRVARERMNDYSKINWKTGEWALRDKEGVENPTRTSILAEKKNPAPWAWIEIEGATKMPEEGEALPVGGTANFPGVFLIVDRGELEFGCFPPNEPVLTSAGFRKISEIKVGDYLFGDAGEWTRVVNLFNRPADRLITFGIRGLHEFTVTPNHPVWAIRREEKVRVLSDQSIVPDWINAGNLNVGDWVGIPKIKKEEDLFVDLLRERNARDKRGSDESILIDEGLAWLLGFFMGDGHASRIEPSVSFSIADDLLLAHVYELMKKYFDEDCRQRRGNGCWQVYCYSARLQRYLRQMFYNVEGKKTFPVTFLFMRKPILREFLKGYYAADGSVEGMKGQLRITTVNHEIYKLTQIAIAKLGITAGGNSKDVYAHTIIWMKKYLNLIDDEPEISERRHYDCLEDDDYFYLPIRRKTDRKYDGDVYNLETEDHTIYTPVRTHNSQKPWFHEYFVQGEGMDYRVIFRQLKMGAETLPPSEGDGSNGNRWLFARPDDLTPYVLGKEAVDKGWMPPVGFSALPEAVRKQVPQHYQYWTMSNQSKAKMTRDYLVDAILKKEIEIDFGAPYKKTVRKEKNMDFNSEIRFGMPIAKVDKEKQLVTGIVLEPDTIDAQGDTIDREAIERAAHNFLAKYNRETEMGLLHQVFGEIGVELVESYLAPVNLEIGGQSVNEGTWLMTVRVKDDKLWKKIKDKEITGFSIGGVAAVV